MRLWVSERDTGSRPSSCPRSSSVSDRPTPRPPAVTAAWDWDSRSSRELVELHGGSVHAHSAGPGEGSTFTVRLPARRVDDEPDRSVVDAPTDRVTLDGINVLVVEDDDDAREIIMRAITDVGASATGVASAADALAMLRERAGTINVIVTDIGMAGVDGYGFLRELRKLPPERGGNLPTIAVTAYVGRDDRKRALQAGFAAHVAKPFAPLTLVSSISRAVQKVRR